MICEECKKLGLKSSIREGMSWATCMGSFPYYDEQGTYHDHDPNNTEHFFRCSNGHEFSEKSYNRCISCDWTNEPRKIKDANH